MTRLVSVGNVMVDVVLSVAALPEPGGDVLARPQGSMVGGSFTTLLAARAAGMATAYAGGHGHGPRGDLVRASMAAAGVEALLPPTPDLDTGYDIVLVDAEGERTFVTVFGAEATLTSDALAEVAVRAGDVLHVSGYGLLEHTNADVLSPWLPTVPRGVTVLVDPGPLVSDIPRDTWATVMARADWLSCNHREASRLTGHPTAEDAAQSLAATGLRVVVRLGANGCLLAEGDHVTAVPGRAVAAVDTTGAGDAHVGIFLASLAAGVQPIEALTRANTGAALAVTGYGAWSSPSSLGPGVDPLVDPAG